MQITVWVESIGWRVSSWRHSGRSASTAAGNSFKVKYNTVTVGPHWIFRVLLNESRKFDKMEELYEEIPALKSNGRCSICQRPYFSVWLECVRFTDVWIIPWGYSLTIFNLFSLNVSDCQAVQPNVYQFDHLYAHIVVLIKKVQYRLIWIQLYNDSRSRLLWTCNIPIASRFDFTSLSTKSYSIFTRLSKGLN